MSSWIARTSQSAGEYLSIYYLSLAWIVPGSHTMFVDAEREGEDGGAYRVRFGRYP